MCRECTKVYRKKHYTNNKPYYVAKAAAHKKRVKKIARDAKKVPCMDCGKSYPYYVMDHDHRGEKNFDISSGVHNKGMAVLRAEMALCDVVCANCHRVRTHLRHLQKKLGT